MMKGKGAVVHTHRFFFANKAVFLLYKKVMVEGNSFVTKTYLIDDNKNDEQI